LYKSDDVAHSHMSLALGRLDQVPLIAVDVRTIVDLLRHVAHPDVAIAAAGREHCSAIHAQVVTSVQLNVKTVQVLKTLRLEGCVDCSFDTADQLDLFPEFVVPRDTYNYAKDPQND